MEENNKIKVEACELFFGDMNNFYCFFSLKMFKSTFRRKSGSSPRRTEIIPNDINQVEFFCCNLPKMLHGVLPCIPQMVDAYFSFLSQSIPPRIPAQIWRPNMFFPVDDHQYMRICQEYMRNIGVFNSAWIISSSLGDALFPPQIPSESPENLQQNHGSPVGIMTHSS